MGQIVFSSSYSTSLTGPMTCRLRVTFSESYNAAANATTLQITAVELQRDGNGTNWGSMVMRGAIALAGETLVDFGNGAGITVSLSGGGYCAVSGFTSGTVTVLHNDDGTRSVTAAAVGAVTLGGRSYTGAYYNAATVFGVSDQTLSVPLTARPRASAIASCPESVATGESLLLTVSRNSGAFFHKASFLRGSAVLAVSDAFAASLSFPIPRAWFSGYPNAAALAVTLSVQTYADESCATAVGSPVTAALTVNADEGMKPAVTSGWAALAPYNSGAVSTITGYVKGYSRAEASFDPTKVALGDTAGAAIASFSVSCQGETVSTSPRRTPVLSAESATVVCTVTDTRGRSASESFPLSVMPYAKPSLTGQTVFRCDSLGAPDGDGAYISVKTNLAFSALGGQNACTPTAALAAAGGSYGQETALTSGTAAILGPVSPDQSYTVRITATDRLGNSSLWYASVPTRRWAMKFRANGSGVAFGKAPESDGVFEIADGWAVKSRGIVDLIYPVGSLYLSVSSTSPATLFGGIWTRIKDRFLLAAGDVYSAGATGGEAAHTLTTDEMPSHRHYVGAVGWPVDAAGPEHINSNWGSSAWPKVTPIDSTDDAGGGAAHNNMPPYLAVYIWKRTG